VRYSAAGKRTISRTFHMPIEPDPQTTPSATLREWLFEALSKALHFRSPKYGNRLQKKPQFA
jgi:hypothetical protein